MAKLLKLRRGTTSQHSSFTGAEGEVTIDTTKDTAVVHDGSQAGGRPLAREDLNNVSGSTVLGRINTNTLNASKIVDGSITNAKVSASAAIAGTKISPNFGSQTVQTTGSSAFPTQSQSDNSTKVATTAYVRTAITEAKPFPTGTKMLFQQTSAPTGWTKVTTHNNKALRVVSGTAGTGGSNAFTNTLASRGINANASNTTAGGNVSVSVANATQGGNVSIGNTTAGGNVSISSVSTSGTVNSHTLTTNQIPSHNHSIHIGGHNQRARANAQGVLSPPTNSSLSINSGTKYFSTGNATTNSTGGNGGHSHGFSGSSHSHTGSLSGTAHNHTASFSGSAHNHSASGSFSGSAHNHSISVGNLDMAVQYVDVIIASKN